MEQYLNYRVWIGFRTFPFAALEQTEFIPANIVQVHSRDGTIRS
jgi:hypothetical protein